MTAIHQYPAGTEGVCSVSFDAWSSITKKIAKVRIKSSGIANLAPKGTPAFPNQNAFCAPEMLKSSDKKLLEVTYQAVGRILSNKDSAANHLGWEKESELELGIPHRSDAGERITGNQNYFLTMSGTSQIAHLQQDLTSTTYYVSMCPVERA